MYGIFVNECGGIPYAAAIVQGYKTIETRTTNTLKQLIGQRVAVIRTKQGKKPFVCGYVTIARAEHCPEPMFPVYFRYHLVPPGSKYDTGKNGKWFYYLKNPETCKPYYLPAAAIRHGRAWCEF